MRFAMQRSRFPRGSPRVGAAAPADPARRASPRRTVTRQAALSRDRHRRVVEGRSVSTSFDQLGIDAADRALHRRRLRRTWFDGARDGRSASTTSRCPSRRRSDTDERTLAAIASYAFAEPAFRAAGGVVEPAGPSRWRVRAHDGIELIAVIDPATSAVRRVDAPDGTPVARYAHEVRVAGATFALDRAGALEPGSLDAAAAASGPLAAPAGAAVTFAGDAPLSLGRESVPVVPCTLAGRAERCLLDTGATPSAVTLEVAEALGLEPHGELEISGLGRFATGLVETGPLVLGPARFASARFAVIPSTAALGFDVVVGSDLLARVRLRLDRAHGAARITAPGGPAPPGTAVPLSFRAGSPVVQATLGSETHEALLDTGDASVVSLGIAAYRVGPQWPVVARGEAVGVAGADDTLIVQLPSLDVGTFAAGPVRATVRRTQAAPHVGVGLWTRFVIDLDEASGRISFSSP